MRGSGFAACSWVDTKINGLMGRASWLREASSCHFVGNKAYNRAPRRAGKYQAAFYVQLSRFYRLACPAGLVLDVHPNGRNRVSARTKTNRRCLTVYWQNSVP